MLGAGVTLFDNVIVEAVGLAIGALPIIVMAIVTGLKNRALQREIDKLPKESLPHFNISAKK